MRKSVQCTRRTIRISDRSSFIGLGPKFACGRVIKVRTMSLIFVHLMTGLVYQYIAVSLHTTTGMG